MFKLVSSCTLTEKVIIGVLSLVFLISAFQIGRVFHLETSEPVASTGGTFVEGVVGEFNFLNPVFAQTSLDRDVASLAFCNLTRFDPISNSIIDDIADHTLSPDHRTYTFKIKENVRWHDGHLVTADDVVFTFREVIQNENFPNPSLTENFHDVLITKIDDRTVTMTLKKKYAFFIYNTNVGLLPKHLLADIPVSDLLTADFNLNPIGCGPYKVDTVTNNVIRLSAFADYYHGRPFIDSIVFRIFNSEKQLLKNIDGISGTKDLNEKHILAFKNDARLKVHNFTLPQYVALFFNTENSILHDKKTRLGLQLATNKKTIIDSLNRQAQIIDTPLLEISTSDWKYEFDAARADGALFDAGWQYRNHGSTDINNSDQKDEDENINNEGEKTLEINSIQSTNNFITKPSNQKFFTTDKNNFYIEGLAPDDSLKIIINGYQLSKFAPDKNTWSYLASTTINTLKLGENEYVIENDKGEFDRIIIFYSSDITAREKWLAEKQPPQPIAKKDEKKENTKNGITQLTTSEDKNESLENCLRYKDDNALTLKLLIPESQKELLSVAEEIKKQWRERGVKLVIECLPDHDFFTRLNKRDYDIVLFGQNLGYNLDAYPFWHSSEARKSGSNLSNLKNSAVNAWLEQVRGSFDSSERRKRLSNLRKVLSDEVPAVMLYTPTYSYIVDQKIKNFNLGHIALKRDRLANVPAWYLRECRETKENIGIWSFIKWLWSNLKI